MPMINHVAPTGAFANDGCPFVSAIVMVALTIIIKMPAPQVMRDTISLRVNVKWNIEPPL